MIKKRVFIANDASFLSTGYGIYGKELLTRLYNSGKYEVAELGCYADPSNPAIKHIPWKFYANAVTADSPESDRYKSNTLNQFGLWKFSGAIADFKPHIVFDVRDYWMFAYQETSPYRRHFNWIIMPATDSAPPKTEWLYTYSNADVIVPYTEWAKQTLQNSCGASINLFDKIANAGINPDEFFPIKNKKQHQYDFFGKDVHIIGTVMRNQKRKLLPDLMLAFKTYLENLKLSNLDELYEKTYLYLHTSYPEENGWSLPDLLLEYNLIDKVYFTYVCRKCGNVFPAKFQTAITCCEKCNNERSCTICSPAMGIDTKKLNEIYNLFDLYVQYAICEGFGMPQVEAASCGVPLASVDYSAMTEIVENLGGFKIPISRTFREMETNADRVYPDIASTAKIFYDFFVNMSNSQKEHVSSETRRKCTEMYTWDNVYRVWDECFSSIDINRKIPWNSVNVSQTNSTIKVPANLDGEAFVEYICNNVINESYLLETSHIQNLIKDMTMGLVASHGGIRTMDRQMIVNTLENHLNNKAMHEQLRLGNIK